MEKDIVFMFSGHGSQYYNMGRDLYLNNKTFKETLDYLDNIYYKLTRISIIDIIYGRDEGITSVFKTFKYTHPAIFMVQYSLYKCLEAINVKPDIILGTSLGEVVSLVVAEVISIEDALEHIAMQVNVIDEYCADGAMVTILDSIDIYEKSPILYMNSEIASINYSENFVVSCKQGVVSNICRYLAENEIMFFVLPVEKGFHSSLIDSAEEKFKSLDFKCSINYPKFKILTSINGERVHEISKDYLWNIIRQPIQFSKTIKKLSKNEYYIFVDVGIGGNLANFVKRNLGPVCSKNIFNIITPFGKEMENLRKIEEVLK